MNIVFEPLLPTWALILCALVLTGALAMFAMRAPRLLWLRAGAATLFVLALAHPVERTEIRERRSDIGLIVLDRSDSMDIADRRADAERAAAALQRTKGGIEWRLVEAPGTNGGGTALAGPIESAAANLPAGRLGAIVVITDGISADAPHADILPRSVPLHVLIAGEKELDDRRLVVEQVPPYSVAGQDAEIGIRVDDPAGGRIPLRIETSAGAVAEQTVTAGAVTRISLPIDRRGRLDVALSVPGRDGEATAINNRALATLNGVTERLRVLLVSGVPYPGGRVWRDVFKSDPNVDLVHFTILRLPSSFDPTPPQDLALIPFPVEELFEERLEHFDLIIFDRFDMTQLMSPVYFTRLAERVRQGGGLLVVAGDEFGDRNSIARTPLASILPARPNGENMRTPYRPALTDVGRRHPVTAALPALWGDTEWGRWSMLAGIDVERGDALMSAPNGRPLLVLAREREGRVGLLASTDTWWWARAVEGAGPRDELLRRTAHWLMQEPDLDEEQLIASGSADGIEIVSRGVEPVSEIVLRSPDGNERIVPLPRREDGVRGAQLSGLATGLYAVGDGLRSRFALVGNAAELSEVQARAEPLGDTARASGGGTFWLTDGRPEVRRRAEGDDMAGNDWLGVARREGGALIAVRTGSLVPPGLLLALSAGLLALSWWRERR